MGLTETGSSGVFSLVQMECNEFNVFNALCYGQSAGSKINKTHQLDTSFSTNP